MSTAETSGLIIGGCQMLMKCCGIQFGTVPFGTRSNFTFYPYNEPNPRFAMGAYQSTGQIIYSTQLQFTKPWARMAFAHEMLHILGWGHSTSSKENIMHTHGSSVLYPTASEARRTIAQNGYPSQWHWPESLTVVGDKIRAERKVFEALKLQYEKYNDLWEKKNKEFEYWKRSRGYATTKERRDYCNVRVISTLKSRDSAGASRKNANDKIIASNKILKTLSDQWLRIKKEWSALFGVNNIEIPVDMQSEESSSGPCSCFDIEYDQVNSLLEQKSLEEIFKELENRPMPEPIPGLRLII